MPLPRVALALFPLCALMASETALAKGWESGAAGFERVTRSRRDSEPMLVLFETDWCKYCKKLKTDILPDQRVKRELRSILKVRVNPEKGRANKELGQMFGVSAFPSLYVMTDPNGSKIQLPFTKENTVEVLLAGLSTALGELGAVRGGRDPRASSAGVDERLELALSQWRSGDLKKAMKTFDQCIRMAPHRADVYDFAATACLEADRSDMAMKYLNKLIKVAPKYDDGRAYFRRAQVYWRRGKKSRALKEAKAACKMGYQAACSAVERGSLL